MKKILYMHSGSANHGCEALLRTIATTLKGPKGVIVCSGNKEEDIFYNASSTVEKVLGNGETENNRFFGLLMRIKKRLTKNFDINKEIIKKRFKGNIAISIGGDNYCYSFSENICDTDAEVRKYCKKMVLWGCSVGEENLTPKIKETLSRFDLIIARESITYELLKQINPNTYLAADSAFLLKKIDCELPKEFLLSNTVGINISPTAVKSGGEIVLENYEQLIEYILQKTNMNICFIPHVVYKEYDDRKSIDYLYKKYEKTGRVCKVDDTNAMELKGYISRCRFFVGARTHATIAAYSTCVPTLVAGYSVKSKGIAKDLFGTYENYVVPVQDMKTNEELLWAFKWLMEHEQEIRNHLTEIMLIYKDKAKLAGEIFEREIIKKK